jgi:hypothetical protein
LSKSSASRADMTAQTKRRKGKPYSESRTIIPS